MTAAASISEFHRLFHLRRAIARLGEGDWMRWWNSNALTDAGRYAIPRIFRRTPDLSAAHVAIAAGRVRHDAAVPSEPLVHLFNLGEAHEGEFQRWLIGRKAEGAQVEALPRPAEEQRRSVSAALAALGLEAGETQAGENGVMLLGTVPESSLQSPRSLLDLAKKLAGGYTASEPGRLVVPYFRVER